MSNTAVPPQSTAPLSTRNLRIVQVATVIIVIVAVAGTVWLQGQQKLLFSTGSNFADELDKREVSAGMRQQFQNNGKTLTPAAQVKVVQQGSNWTIVDAGKRYSVRNENQKLNVYYYELLDRIGGSPWALPALFLASVISSATLFLPVPGLAITTLVGSLINPLAVGIVAGVGQTLGEMTGYMAGYSGQGLVERTKAYERIEGWMKHNEFGGELVVFVLALIPNPLFDAAGMAAGALRFPAWKFLLAAGIGKIIKNIIFAYGGSLGIGWLSKLFGG